MTEHKQLTAVEWYAIEHRNLLIQLENKQISIGEYVVKHQDIRLKAKQMEKEQMLWFFRKFHMINEESNSSYIKEFEHHYNETYGKD